MKAAYGVIGVVVACSVSVAAQWAKVPDPSVPRDAQGNMRKDAPPPRTADGKTDLSGMWMRANSGPPGRAAAAARRAGAGRGSAAARPAARQQAGTRPAAAAPAAGAAAAAPDDGNASGGPLPGATGGVSLEPHDAPFPVRSQGPPVATFFEAGGNMEGGLPYTPWARGHQETAHDVDQQGQPRRELPADGLPAVPPAAAAAQDHPDAEADPD